MKDDAECNPSAASRFAVERWTEFGGSGVVVEFLPLAFVSDLVSAGTSWNT